MSSVSSSASGPRTSPRKAGLFAATLLVIAGICFCLFKAKPNWGFDFYNYWVVAESVRQDPTIDIYDAAADSKLASKWRKYFAGDDPRVRNAAEFREVIQLELTATPLFYALTSLFTHQNMVRSFDLFSAVEIALFIAALLLLLHDLGVRRDLALCLVGIELLACSQLHRDLDFGNGSVLQLFAAALAVWLLARGRLEWAGIVVALAIWLKPNFALVPTAIVVFWVRGRAWRPLLRATSGLAVGSAIAHLACFAYWGSFAPWLRWFERVLPRMLNRTDLGTLHFNVSPVEALGEIAGFDLFSLALAFAAWWLLVLCLIPAPRDESDPRATALYGLALGGLGLLLAHKLVWFHYQLLLLPAALLLLSRWRELRPAHRALLIAALIAVQLDPELFRGHELAYALANCACVVSVFVLLVMKSPWRAAIG